MDKQRKVARQDGSRRKTAWMPYLLIQILDIAITYVSCLKYSKIQKSDALAENEASRYLLNLGHGNAFVKDTFKYPCFFSWLS